MSKLKTWQIKSFHILCEDNHVWANSIWGKNVCRCKRAKKKTPRGENNTKYTEFSLPTSVDKTCSGELRGSDMGRGRETSKRVQAVLLVPQGVGVPLVGPWRGGSWVWGGGSPTGAMRGVGDHRRSNCKKTGQQQSKGQTMNISIFEKSLTYILPLVNQIKWVSATFNWLTY